MILFPEKLIIISGIKISCNTLQIGGLSVGALDLAAGARYRNLLFF